ncbi:Drug/metabolite transporter [Diplonema papillatum]|nr:Drug/metabolite transporter [Diplonema papillatum]
MAHDEPKYGTFESSSSSSPENNTLLVQHVEATRAPLVRDDPATRKQFWFGITCFAVALNLFAQTPCVVKVLYTWDPAVYTVCSILCAANTVAMVSMPILFWKDITPHQLCKLTRHELLSLVASSVLYSAIAPLLQYTGVQYISIPTMAVSQRLEAVNFAALAYCFLSAPMTKWAEVNYIVIVAAVVAYWLLDAVQQRDHPQSPNTIFGIVCIVLSGWANSSSLIILKSQLSKLRSGQVAVIRVVLGGFFFHILASVNEDHGEYTTGKLWANMLWFGLVYITLAQWLWTTALQLCSPPVIAIGISAMFPLQIFWSFVILPGFPTNTQLALGAFLCIVTMSQAFEVHKNSLDFMSPRIIR